MNISPVKPGYGYRLLTNDEPVMPGDEYWSGPDNKWYPTLKGGYGLKPGYGRTYRRAINPGDGYRLVPKGATIEVGDEVSYDGIKWEEPNHPFMGEPVDGTLLFRRCAPHAALTNNDPGPDHVLLSKGDTIQEGDEIWMYDTWDECKLIGQTVECASIRRRKPKVAVINPGDGYRLLAAGESLALGDEYLAPGALEWLAICRPDAKGYAIVGEGTDSAFKYRRPVPMPAEYPYPAIADCPVKVQTPVFDLAKPAPLLWLDLETTGLDPRRDLILEIAMVATDADLTVEAEATVVLATDAREVNERLFERPEVLKMHLDNGLCEALRTAPGHMTAGPTEEHLIEKFLFDLGRPMAGTKPSFDRGFLEAQMPRLARLFSHRDFDMNTVYAFTGWPKPKVDKVEPGLKHRALPDLHRDIEELRKIRAALRTTVNPNPQETK